MKLCAMLDSLDPAWLAICSADTQPRKNGEEPVREQMKSSRVGCTASFAARAGLPPVLTSKPTSVQAQAPP